MGLRGWSWDAVAGPAGAGNRPLLEALEAALPDAAVEEAIERTGTRERRRRVLPTHLVVTLVVAMGLWAEESVRHALAAVVDGWAETRARRAAALGPPAAGAGRRARWRLPSTAAIVRARRRAGVRLFRELFHAVAGPIATPATPGRLPGRAAPHGRRRDDPGRGRHPGERARLRAPDDPPRARGLPPAAGGGPHRDGHARPVRRGAAPVPRRRGPGGAPPAARRSARACCCCGTGASTATSWSSARWPGAPHFLGRTKTNVVLPPDRGAAGRLVPVRRLPLARRRGAAARAGSSCAWSSTPWTPPPGRARERYRLLTSLLDPAAFPADGPGRDLPRAVGGGDRPGRGQGAPVGPPPPPAQPAPPGGGPGGLRPAAGPPGHPHPDVPGGARGTGSTPTG